MKRSTSRACGSRDSRTRVVEEDGERSCSTEEMLPSTPCTRKPCLVERHSQKPALFFFHEGACFLAGRRRRHVSPARRSRCTLHVAFTPSPPTPPPFVFVCCFHADHPAPQPNESGQPSGDMFLHQHDIRGLPCYRNNTVMAIRAPAGTTLEVGGRSGQDGCNAAFGFRSCRPTF